MQWLFFKVIVSSILFEDVQSRIVDDTEGYFSIKVFDRLFQTVVVIRTNGNDLKSSLFEGSNFGNEFLNLLSTGQASGTEIEDHNRRLAVKFPRTDEAFIPVITKNKFFGGRWAPAERSQ